MTMRISLSGAFIAVFLAVYATATSPARAQTAPALPAGEGRDIVAVACTQCHTLNPLTALRDGPVGWKRHVYNMVIRGAQLSPRDVDTVLQYLNTNFGPGQSLPPAKPIALAPGAGKELVETRCALCHDLERVTAAKRQKREWPGVVANMFDRFGLSAPDEASAISSYLAANYGMD
jgi:mono/diheme cytochrome c family protein